MNRSPSTIYHLLPTRWASRSGQALVEFTLMAVLLMVLLFAIIDFGRAFHLKQILINVSREGANLTSRGTDSTNALNAVVTSAQPLDINSSGYVILSTVTRDANGVARVTEQVRRGGLTSSSRIGAVGAVATLPNNNVPPNNQRLYVAEVFYQFQGVTPLSGFLSFTLPARFYDVAYF
ncbi:MAG: pilus assembly protein [Verrucomicrobia bacterium]|nr:pilus assembly protein [Verrucomicrobiota bacterium]